jgi:hypothetical protein
MVGKHVARQRESKAMSSLRFRGILLGKYGFLLRRVVATVDRPVTAREHERWSRVSMAGQAQHSLRR